MKFATLRRVAPAQTLPRGESGPEAGDGSAAQTCSSVHTPAGANIGFGGGFCLCFPKQNTGISFRACPRSQNAKTATARFLRRGFPNKVFSRDTHICLCNGVSYPCPRALATYIVREKCERSTGNYRENGAGENCDPLHLSRAATLDIINTVAMLGFHVLGIKAQFHRKLPVVAVHPKDAVKNGGTGKDRCQGGQQRFGKR